MMWVRLLASCRNDVRIDCRHDGQAMCTGSGPTAGATRRDSYIRYSTLKSMQVNPL